MVTAWTLWIGALGIVLIYRASRVRNLAHGVMAMFPAYVTLELRGAGLPVLPAMMVGVATGALMGAAVEGVRGGPQPQVRRAAPVRRVVAGAVRSPRCIDARERRHLVMLEPRAVGGLGVDADQGVVEDPAVHRHPAITARPSSSPGGTGRRCRRRAWPRHLKLI